MVFFTDVVNNVTKIPTAANAGVGDIGGFCVECKPGYKPLRVTAASEAIYECEEITNCATTIPNNCLECEDDFAFYYNDTDDVIEFD